MNSFLLDLNTAISAVFAEDKNSPQRKKVILGLCFASFLATLRFRTLSTAMFYTTVLYTLIWNARILHMMYRIRKQGRMDFIMQMIHTNQQNGQTTGNVSLLHLMLTMTDRDFDEEGMFYGIHRKRNTD